MCLNWAYHCSSPEESSPPSLMVIISFKLFVCDQSSTGDWATEQITGPTNEQMVGELLQVLSIYTWSPAPEPLHLRNLMEDLYMLYANRIRITYLWDTANDRHFSKSMSLNPIDFTWCLATQRVSRCDTRMWFVDSFWSDLQLVFTAEYVSSFPCFGVAEVFNELGCRDDPA